MVAGWQAGAPGVMATMTIPDGIERERRPRVKAAIVGGALGGAVGAFAGRRPEHALIGGLLGALLGGLVPESLEESCRQLVVASGWEFVSLRRDSPWTMDVTVGLPGQYFTFRVQAVQETAWQPEDLTDWLFGEFKRSFAQWRLTHHPNRLPQS